MTTIPVFTSKKSTATATFPAEWLEGVSHDALRQALRVYEAARHPGLPRVKSRGEVSLTTKKMYAQKHTGNARHGAASAPIFVGGGVTHGPDGVKRVLRLPFAFKKAALNTALSLKIEEKKLGAVELSSLKKTKEAAFVISQTGEKKVLVGITRDNWEKAMIFRNIKDVVVAPIESINAYEVTKAHFVLLDGAAFEKNTVKEETNKKSK